MPEVNETNQVESNDAATFAYPVTFRAVAETDKKFLETKLAFDAAGVDYEEITEINGKPSKGILRKAFDLQLPVVSVMALLEIAPAFVQQVVNDLVSRTVRIKFIDKLLPVSEFSLEDVVEANTPKAREVAVPKELLIAFLTYITSIMKAKNVKEGTVAVILDLVKNKFGSAILFKHQRQAAAYPVLLSAVISYVELDIEAIDKFAPVVKALSENYQSWLEAQAAESEEIDLSDLA